MVSNSPSLVLRMVLILWEATRTMSHKFYQEYTHKLVVEGGATWAFGLEFWLQAAMFERTGYADWEITISYDDKRRIGKVKRIICTDYRLGKIVKRSGLMAFVNFPDLFDSIYSTTETFDWARQLVRQLEFVEWEEET